MRKLITILFFLLSISLYAQTHILEVSKIHINEETTEVRNSFVHIVQDKELLILKMEGYESLYFNIINVYVSEEDNYSTFTLQGKNNQPLTVVMYFDNREKNLQINYPQAVTYLTVTKIQ